jgi:hypothetical protein
MRQESIQKKKNGVKKDISKSYNQFKEFEGKKYTGMKVKMGMLWLHCLHPILPGKLMES